MTGMVFRTLGAIGLALAGLVVAGLAAPPPAVVALAGLALR
jgi:hypothetical protein